jgi:flagellar FliL protein
MAYIETRKDNDDVEEVEAKPKKSQPWALYGVIGLLVLVLMAGAAVGALYYAGVFNVGLSTDAKGINQDAEDYSDEEETDDEEDLYIDENRKAAIYVPIEPTFVVNFEGKSKVKFLQVSVEVMTRDESVVESIKKHMPVIRNNLTFLFSGRTYEDVKTIKGKERLRTAALEEVQNIMEEETGNSAVEALYFTSFVTQ